MPHLLRYAFVSWDPLPFEVGEFLLWGWGELLGRWMRTHCVEN
ncbi:hypothetical protein STVIR_5920 [Streptomyces viridochromogenes Tue57]|uniref:Uncharacterized protein n=1 Tax=Streptomyces viridochromogenes Tue57 TaxID=1160705 RepID=L8PAN0_STRVR|nr:hypothetical protein STVIR_5920 [Streptomyces viridochromogenes Tue57]